jgi:hypothetical protein
MLFAPNSPVYAPRFSTKPTHSPVDMENPDYKKYPRVNEVQPYMVDLEAGETLYIPSFWWHQLRGLEPSIAVSFLWSRNWKLPIAGLAWTYTRLFSK